MRSIALTSFLALSYCTVVIQAATILHGNRDFGAISHQSFTRLSSSAASSSTSTSSTPLILRIVNAVPAQPQLHHFYPKEDAKEEQITERHTPAHLTYSARPVVHQMVPRVKPVRNISFASLVPGPRSLTIKTTQNHHHNNLYPV
ncbi:uncharacterized protein Dwil_GK27758 [Drosophila willistoni]|uniref:DUF243 domain-containing protein n=1 Tax=Drosophila willistoni TaxID=7260 RepID=A0A0Q9X1H8_DROWI|nr:uncharacterized protein LOC26529760 [Drosophila willistoni]KRF97789.1 uncharacterized protein Dwil_GK27758 [Drosophila willistoni]